MPNGRTSQVSATLSNNGGSFRKTLLGTRFRQLGIKVAKVLRLSKDTVKCCLCFLEENPTDLIVLAVSQREGHMR